MAERTGIIGFTGAFKENVAEVRDGGKLVFAGSVAVCTPFAELLAYAVRDRGFELIYMPRAILAEARRMVWKEGIGFGVSEERADPRGADVLVVLGGLAMPRYGCSVQEVEVAIRELTVTTRPKLIGVCFMSIFERNGWSARLPFDVMIDTRLEVDIKH